MHVLSDHLCNKISQSNPFSFVFKQFVSIRNKLAVLAAFGSEGHEHIYGHKTRMASRFMFLVTCDLSFPLQRPKYPHVKEIPKQLFGLS